MCDPRYEDEYYDGDGFDGYGYGYGGADEEAARTPHNTAAAVVTDCGDQCDERTLTLTEVLAMQSSVVQEVTSLTCLSSSVAALLLCQCNWLRDVAVERYYANEAATLQQLRVTPALATQEVALCPGVAGEMSECLICGMECSGDEIAHLSTCGHCFCIECWRDHVKSRLEENLIAAACPAQGCFNIIGLHIMCDLFVADPEMTRQIRRKYLTNYVEACPTLHWCPNKEGCEGILYVPIAPLQGQGVRCSVCKKLHCIRCGTVPHRPASCDNMRRWQEYCGKEGSNLAYILDHTKPCPKCKKNIEKNGGCNHMHCKCGHEFCWVCLADWSSHQGNYYSCRNAESSGTAATAADVTQARHFTYHFTRYTMHLDSERADRTLMSILLNSPARRQQELNILSTLTKTRGTHASATLEGTSVSDPVTLQYDAVVSDSSKRITDALFTARNVLAHSYVAMYYIDPQSPESPLMAHRVGKLEEATEALSESLTRLLLSRSESLGPYFDAADVLLSWCKALCEA